MNKKLKKIKNKKLLGKLLICLPLILLYLALIIYDWRCALLSLGIGVVLVALISIGYILIDDAENEENLMRMNGKDVIRSVYMEKSTKND